MELFYWTQWSFLVAVSLANCINVSLCHAIVTLIITIITISNCISQQKQFNYALERSKIKSEFQRILKLHAFKDSTMKHVRPTLLQ